MSINTTGRIVKAKKKDLLRPFSNARLNKSLDYSHIRVQFADNSERHFLFTDSQLIRARDRAENPIFEDIKISWVHEIWYESYIDESESDLDDLIDINHLPVKLAKKFSHIRVKCGNDSYHFLFTDSEIRSALSRSEGIEQYLPKISWLSKFNKESKVGCKK